MCCPVCKGVLRFFKPKAGQPEKTIRPQIFLCSECKEQWLLWTEDGKRRFPVLVQAATYEQLREKLGSSKELYPELFRNHAVFKISPHAVELMIKRRPV